MKNIIEWLVTIETLSAVFYRNSARFVDDDMDFVSFLYQLATDEEEHRQALEKGVRLLSGQGRYSGLSSGILLDLNTRTRIEKPFREGIDLIDTGKLTVHDILGILTEAEYSEWNDIFLYVIDSLKSLDKEFQYYASRMQGHMNRISDEIARHDLPDGISDRIKALKPVWEYRILVVDDDEPIVRFLSGLCGRLGKVDTALNGKEALVKTNASHYDAIISDIDMPVMNGIEFYKSFAAGNPGARDRFLFLTGNSLSENDGFILKSNIRMIRKPSSIEEIMDSLRIIMDRK